MTRVIALVCATLVAAQPASLDAVLSRLDAYLADYQPRLSELVADESMHQEVRGTRPAQPSDVTRGDNRFPLRRQLESEVAFIALPDDRGWLGFRHVKTVNARPVALGDASLSATLSTPGFDAARELLIASATHNLGLSRTTNLPNLPLEFLHKRNRHRLLPRLNGTETVRGVRTVKVVFIERVTPTLILNPESGGDMPSVIRAWVDPRDGRLLRAEVETFPAFGAKQYSQDLQVEFAHDRTFGLLVPMEMREVFPAADPGRGTGVARYSNFRRFQTSARIVPQEE